MTIQEILEAHKLMDVSHLVLTHEYCNCNELFENKTTHRSHLAEVLDEAMREREAEAVRVSARYIERLYTLNGPINKADVLADLEVAADRLSRGLHAN